VPPGRAGSSEPASFDLATPLRDTCLSKLTDGPIRRHPANVHCCTRLHGIQWANADPTQIVKDAGSERIFLQKGASQELIPTDLMRAPELAAVIEAVDYESPL
jgi:hypothetical protein